MGLLVRQREQMVGTLGDSQGITGPGVGIFGQKRGAPKGIAELFINRAGGNTARRRRRAQIPRRLR